MSLVNLAHVCSHLQNASKARLGMTSIPVSKLHVRLMLELQKQGFLSSVTLGGPTPPLPFVLQHKPSPEEVDKMASQLKEEPWLAFPLPDVKAPTKSKKKTAIPESSDSKPDDQLSYLDSTPLYRVEVPANPAQRRLWLGLKYWNNRPVLSHMKLISKPTRRIWVPHADLAVITRGRRAGYVAGLTTPGECLYVSTDRGILEARECVERRLGGQPLCRVW